MKQEEILLALLENLEKNGISYYLTGSFASNLHGVPRMTQDADIVVEASLDQLLRFARETERSFYASESAIREAVGKERMFNMIHIEEGYKFDIIPMKKNDPFDIARLQRRAAVDFRGKKVYFSSAEDTILAKLLWASLSDSERQLKDAKGILEVQSDQIDRSYLNQWADRLGLRTLLEKIRHA